MRWGQTPSSLVQELKLMNELGPDLSIWACATNAVLNCTCFFPFGSWAVVSMILVLPYKKTPWVAGSKGNMLGSLAQRRGYVGHKVSVRHRKKSHFLKRQMSLIWDDNARTDSSPLLPPLPLWSCYQCWHKHSKTSTTWCSSQLPVEMGGHVKSGKWVCLGCSWFPWSSHGTTADKYGYSQVVVVAMIFLPPRFNTNFI